MLRWTVTNWLQRLNILACFESQTPRLKTNLKLPRRG
jgi:hypothetical protein